jgi:hypothetical protein
MSIDSQRGSSVQQSWERLMVIAFGIGWELRKTTGMVGALQCYVYLFMAPSSSTISFSTIHYLGMR